jgi:hypothetical protein
MSWPTTGRRTGVGEERRRRSKKCSGRYFYPLRRKKDLDTTITRASAGKLIVLLEILSTVRIGEEKTNAYFIDWLQ